MHFGKSFGVAKRVHEPFVDRGAKEEVKSDGNFWKIRKRGSEMAKAFKWFSRLFSFWSSPVYCGCLLGLEHQGFGAGV